MADVSKVVINGNTVFDLTGVTVTPDKLAKGVTAHDKTGAQITGTAEKASGDTATLYCAEEAAAEGYSSPDLGTSNSNTTKYASTSDYCGYAKNEAPIALKTASIEIVMFQCIGLLHGYTTEYTSGSGDNKKKHTAHHYVGYYADTWYPLFKFPSAVGTSNDKHFEVYGQSEAIATSDAKLSSDGTVWIKFYKDVSLESDEYMRGLLALEV